jgi:hypothetical protein
MTTEELDMICAELMYSANVNLCDDMHLGYITAIDHFRMKIYAKSNTQLPPLPDYDPG